MLDWLSKLNARQKAVLADKVLDTANVAIGALGFGQVLGGRWSLTAVVVGSTLWLGLCWFSLGLLGEEHHDVS